MSYYDIDCSCNRSTGGLNSTYTVDGNTYILEGVTEDVLVLMSDVEPTLEVETS